MRVSIDSRQSDIPRDEALDVLRLAFAFAMIAATAQLLRAAYVHFIQDSFAWVSRDALWMTPIGFLAILSAVLLLQRALGTFIRPLGTTRWLAFTAAAHCAYSILLNLAGIAPAARLILAIGTASVLAPVLTSGPGGRVRSLTRAGVMLAVGFAALATAERASRTPPGVKSRQIATADTAAPNVLFLIWDTVRASNLSLYGYERPTSPVLASLAREGAVFTAAISPSSWSLPSHVSFLTGYRAGSSGVDWRKPYDGRFPTLAEAFREANYATGAFTGNLSYTTWESGLSRGFDRYVDYRTTAKQVLWSANLMQVEMVRKFVHARTIRQIVAAIRLNRFGVAKEPENDPVRAADVVRRFLDWKRDQPGRPFFAFLNFFDAHAPFATARAYRTMFVPSPTLADEYDGSIRYMDDQLAILVDSLRSHGELDRTILVITSDHGEQFGEHGLTSHGNSLYTQLVHVPLVIRFPSSVPAGVRVTGPVSTSSLPATIASLAGLRSARFPGRSLAPTSQSVSVVAGPVLSEVGPLDGDMPAHAPNVHDPLQSVVVDRWQLVQGPNRRHELFDIAADPAARFDLSGVREHGPELARLRDILASLLRDDAHPSRSLPASMQVSMPVRR